MARRFGVLGSVFSVVMGGCAPMVSSAQDRADNDAIVEDQRGQPERDSAATGDVVLVADASADDVQSTPDASVSDVLQPDASAGDASVLGGVRVLREGCAASSGPLAGTTCRTLEVTCGGLEPLEVELLVTTPAAGVASRGVILFGSGGAGTGLWSGPATTNQMMERLRRAGFLLIERRWLNDRNEGWFKSSAGLGVAASACRHATLVRWIDRTYRTGDQPLCATGNSGGSAELGWSITRQDSSELLDFALLSSGPVHRADYGCAPMAPAAWTAECAALNTRNCAGCASRTCTLANGVRSLIDAAYGTQTTCSGRATPFDAARMLADSPVPSGRLNLPRTRVTFLIGALDPGPYLPLAAGLYEAMRAAGTSTSLSVVAGVDHEFQTFADGAARIESELMTQCVRRH